MNASLGTLWLGALISFALVAGAMPPVLRAWRSLGRRDDEVSLRKVHTGQIPRAGGLVILFGFGVMLVAGLAGVSSLSATHELFSVSPLTGALVGALVVGLTGAYDDLIGLRPRTKLAMQLVGATLAVLYGLHWPALELLVGWEYNWLATLLTIGFLVASVNAVNMMDGLDGLAAGICLVGFGTVVAAIFAGPTIVPGTLAVGWAAACALGATGGFLLHNRHPARVFMGDAGSYFLGFLLPALLVQVGPVRWRVPEIQLSIAILPLAVPMFDMTLAIVRRTLRGQPIFSGDSDHVHHRLMAAGFTHARAVTVLWLSAAMFASLAYLNVIGIGGWWTLLGTLVAMLLAAVLLGYHRMLAQLPAFTGERFLGWRDRRREVMELLDTLEHVRLSGTDRGEARWRRVAPDLALVLGRLGIPAFQIRRFDDVVVGSGDARDAWAWLSLPVPGEDGAELRLALAVRLPELQQERLMLIERAVLAVAGGGGAAARQLTVVRGGGERPSAAAP
ncbi:MAG: undecaprenyl/decaprenyl-phosphate alpha-N-acetylglucosaminyl 1-phosphate transferase [Nannocystaceae bacterium]|nr:undecaprenyl/decaprenyl-phosphate alpha-N-acetylglucosaminyl 1-phosphate transferase [Nannocystaceae bacterium]